MSGGITDDNQRGHAATSGRNTTETERHKAALYVCHRGQSLDDRRELLLALGLLPPDFSWTSTGPHGPRKKVTE